MSRFVFWIKCYVPRTLPIGMASFNSWLTDIVKCSGLPDNSSTRRVAASFIFQLPTRVKRISIREISNQLVKAASYQVAHQILQDEKANEDKARSQSPSVTLVPPIS